MLQVLIGLFTSYRDGDDALQALQALGLNPGTATFTKKVSASRSLVENRKLPPRICTQKSAQSMPHMVSI